MEFYELRLSFSLILGVFGLIYLIHSSVSILRWFLSERWVDLQSWVKLSSFCSRYPQSCFSPTELKNFLARVQSTEPHCTIQVTFLFVLEDLNNKNCNNQVKRSAQLCPGLATDLTKEFSPHLWTEFTESIDVVGARKNRIESAQNISDVLEVWQWRQLILSKIWIHILTPGTAKKKQSIHCGHNYWSGPWRWP